MRARGFLNCARAHTHVHTCALYIVFSFCEKRKNDFPIDQLTQTNFVLL